MNRPNLIDETLGKKESTVSQSASIPIIIEVVSRNWRDHYLKKYADYEEMGIPEYWIVDYAALGGREFIGKPKQPTILVSSLDESDIKLANFEEQTVFSSEHFPS